MILSLVSYQLALTLLVGALSYCFFTPHIAISVISGSLFVGTAFILLVWSWYQIFYKKWVALAVGVIVFKYAILVGIIYLLLSKKLVNVPALAIGFSTLFPLLGLFAYRFRKLEEDETEIELQK